MTDESLTVLGLSTAVADGTLVVHRAVVTARQGQITVKVLESWQATRNDEARSLSDLVDALTNSLDRKRANAPEAVAIKRVEVPLRGKPPKSYDQRTRAEGAAMVAAASQGVGYFGYRLVEIRPRGQHLREAAASLPEYPGAEEQRHAVDVACAALAELGT